MKNRAWLLSSRAALPLILASLACGESEDPGSVMLAISTDMYIDKDVSRVDIIIQPERGPTQTTQFNLFPALDGKFLPGTFAIVEGSTPGEFVRVRIIARQENAVRVVREAALRVPRRRTALLSMPIQWLCDQHINLEEQLPHSSCPDGQTCGKGSCETEAVDEATLPDYLPADVFGGGNPTGGGTCFDTLPCFESSTEPELDDVNCVLETMVSDDLNIGIRLPPGSDGHCTNAECWIPLDASPLTGWEAIDGGARVQLPSAVCEHVRSGGASVRVSHECASKAPGTPTCGPWTLVGTEPGGDGNIDGAPLTVTDQEFATELQTAAKRLGRSVATACASITQSSPPDAPSPAEVVALCTAASSDVAGLDTPAWYHVTTRCWPDHGRQLACERACAETCNPGSVEDRCDSAAISGACDDLCTSRDCLGTSNVPVACPGACDGTCSGSCDGDCVGPCDGTCATPGADGYCAGRCDGVCVGLCQGRCDGTCQGTCDADPNLPVSACAEGAQCRGGCAGAYSSPVCHSPLTASPCSLDAECEADCRALGAIGVACEAATSWVLPPNGLDAARRADLEQALADLIPVRDVEGVALLDAARRIADRLRANASTSGDPLGALNAANRVQAAVDLVQAATQGASDVLEAAGAPLEAPGALIPNLDCVPAAATGDAPLIDDFEDNDSQILVQDGRDGSWHIERDNSADGQLSMGEPPLPDNNGAHDSQHAMHLAGSNFTEWGAGFSVDLRTQSLPYDASAHAGLKFWARGKPSLRLVFIQQDLVTGHPCAACSPTSSDDCGLFYGTGVALTDTWAQYSIAWSELSQAAAGTTAFAPDQLLSIAFEAPAAEQFELWLDDVSFY